MFRKNS